MSLRRITLVFISVIFGFLFWNIYRNWPTIKSFPWIFHYQNLVLLIIFLLPIYAINAFSWHLLLKALGAKTSYLKNFRIWVFSNYGRFLPGVIWQYAGRVYLSSQAGIPKTIVTTAVVFEALLTIIVAALVILISLLILPLPVQLQESQNFFIAVAFTAFGLLLITLFLLSNEKFFIKVLFCLQKITKKVDITLIKIQIIKKLLPVLIFSFFLEFLFGGSVLFFLSRFAVALPFSSYPLFIGIYAASWLLGYITFFAPSGLGVQEITLAGLLSFYTPFPIASVIAVAFRISLMTSETFALLFNLLISKKKQIFR